MKTATISRRALLQRINRALGSENQVLRATRGEMDRAELGDYYIVDVARHAVTKKNVDPVKLGLDLGVLRKYERLVD